MSDTFKDNFLRSSTSGIPDEKDLAKKNELQKQKTVLETEQRALQSVLLQLRGQQRDLMLENNKLKKVWQYREKVRNGEIEDPDVRYALEYGGQEKGPI